MIGLPLDGAKTLFVLIISVCASTCASIDSGKWTAIWSPSKSALNPLQTSGCKLIALPFDQSRLESLNSHPVQCGGSVEQDWVIRDHLLENVPDFFVLSLEHFLRRLDRVGVAELFESTNDERLVQFQRDLLRQSPH